MISSSLSQSLDPMEQQIIAHTDSLRMEGRVVFEGIEAIDVIRRYCAMTGFHKPQLFIHCEIEVGEPEREWEEFLPFGVVIDGETREIEVVGKVGQDGYERKFRFDPSILADRKGRYISYVSTKPTYKRWPELQAIELLPII